MKVKTNKKKEEQKINLEIFNLSNRKLEAVETARTGTNRRQVEINTKPTRKKSSSESSEDTDSEDSSQ